MSSPSDAANEVAGSAEEQRTSSQAGTAASSGEPSSSGARFPRMLIVDDNSINCKVLCRVLAALGFPEGSFRAVGDGQQAVAAYEECYRHPRDHPTHSPFDIVFMDLDMPVMNGLEATIAIRHLAQAADLAPPNIVGMVIGVPLKPCFQAGMVDAIEKPISLQVLRKVIRKHW